MADFFSDIGNWWNSIFQQPTNIPASQVNEAVRNNTMMYAGPNWSAPAAIQASPTSIAPSTAPVVQPAAPPANPASIYDSLFSSLTGGTTISPYQQAQLDADKWQFQTTQDRLQQQALATQKYQEQQLAQQQASQAAEAAYRTQQLQAEQQWRTQQLEADKQQRLATLAAQPKSWLEYAALANQAPVTQPWMLPLMQGDYTKSQVGSPISGWTPENMKGMPDLINPSAQYLARLTPSARDQYYGYQQADTGATQEDTEWQLWNQSPAGSVKNLSYSR